MLADSRRAGKEVMTEAAIRLVAADGIEHFTTRAWAAEAGVSEGALYYHFQGKEGLLMEAFFLTAGKMADAYAADGISGLRRLLAERPELARYAVRYRVSSLCGPRALLRLRELLAPLVPGGMEGIGDAECPGGVKACGGGRDARERQALHGLREIQDAVLLAFTASEGGRF